MIDSVLIIHQEADDRAERRKRAEREAVIERVKRTGKRLVYEWEWCNATDEARDRIFRAELDHIDSLKELLSLD